LIRGDGNTRRKTFKDSRDDYSIRIDGLTAGSIMKETLSAQRQAWFWTLTGPYIPPTLQPGSGERERLDQAQDEFKAAFWKWHQLALTQPSGAIWHGASE
jgi:hypothetical protein